MNTVTVKINGVEYNLRGREDVRYLFDVAAYVDTKVREISDSNKKLSTSSAAVLTAVNIADELFKCDLEISNLNKSKNSIEEKYLSLKEAYLELKQELDKINKNKELEIADLNNTIIALEEKLKEQEKIEDLNEDLTFKLENIEKENTENLKSISKLNDDLNYYKNKNNELMITVKNCTEEINSRVSIEDFNKVTSALDKAEKTNTTLNKEKEALKIKLNECENSIHAIEAKYEQEVNELSSKYEKETSELHVKFEDETLKLKEEYDNKISNLSSKYENKLSKATSENNLLSKINIQLDEKVKIKEIELKDYMNCSEKRSEEEFDSLKSQISIMEEQLKATLSEKDNLKARNKEIKFQLQNFKYKILDLEKKLIDAQFNLAVEKKEKNPLLR